MLVSPPQLAQFLHQEAAPPVTPSPIKCCDTGQAEQIDIGFIDHSVQKYPLP
jgi:hypothetical protein